MFFQKKCPKCGREFRVNRDGEIRRHWCLPEVGDSKALTFATGGTLRVRLEANWMLFGEDERALLNTIIDAMHTYEQQHAVQEQVEEPESVGAVDPVLASSVDPSTREKET
jgi:hypothetical protein